jgi:hypothetical protein
VDALAALLALNAFNAILPNHLNAFLLLARVDSISAQETVWLAHSIAPLVHQEPFAQP